MVCAASVLLMLMLLLALPAAHAQGTWLRTGCLAAAGATVTVGAPATTASSAVPSSLGGVGARTVPACKAAPAWGNTGSEYVQAALAQADAASVMPPVANLANSGTALPTAPPAAPKTSTDTDSADSEALLVSFSQKAQLAATLLGYLDARAPLAGYRWNGPTATDAALAALAAPNLAAPSADTNTNTNAGSANNSAVLAGWQLMSNPGLGGNGRGSSWWLQGVYGGATETQPLSLALAEAGAQLPFLAATCPQVEGKAVGSSSDRCTVAVNSVPEPGTWALVLLAGGLMWALRLGGQCRSV